jgi:hypothetical protein
VKNHVNALTVPVVFRRMKRGVPRFRVEKHIPAVPLGAKVFCAFTSPDASLSDGSRQALLMTFVDHARARAENPVDVIEHIALRNNWSFERDDETEISISVTGRWCDYQLSFTWLAEMEALHLGCAFDLKVPDRRRAEVIQLITKLNEQMWVGHFDLWTSGNAIMFRHSLLLAGGAHPSTDQCETAMKIAVEACERYYQAFQFVVWAGKTAAEALDTAMFETAGEA